MGLGLPKFVYRDADAFPYTDTIDAAVASPSLWLLPGLSDIDLARRDFASGNLLSYNGTPDVAAHYITGKGATNYFKTGILETEEFSVCAIFKQDDTQADNAHLGKLFGSFAGAGALGCLAGWTNATTFSFQCYQGTSTAKAVTLTPTSPTVHHRFTFTCSALEVAMYNETDTTVDTEAITAARLAGTLPVSVLSTNSVSFLGLQGCYSFAWWPRLITTDERNAHWAQMALHTARDGVSVG